MGNLVLIIMCELSQGSGSLSYCLLGSEGRKMQVGRIIRELMGAAEMRNWVE